jgi:hypothetical protein
VLSVITIQATAQKETYDLISYHHPKGWTKEANNNITSYFTTNSKTNTWCRIIIVKSTVSKGSIDTDFDSEWKELAAKNYQITEGPEVSETQEADGWKIKAGSGKFSFDGKNAMVMVSTISGYGRCASIVAITNSDAYSTDIMKFLEEIELNKPETPSNANTIQQQPVGVNGFQFNTTNFDDGWTSTVQVDWVEVVKGNIKVLIHYPREGTIFPADPEPLTNAAWNILVAPRYSSLKNYKTTYITTYNRPYLGMGTATDNASGKEVFIVLYRQGQTGWLEFVTNDKSTFIQQFKFDPETIRWDSETDLLKPMEKMVNYNKFAIAASDFTGTWTSDFTGVQQLYHVYTGNYAGMNIHQSNQEFVFGADNLYNWKLLVVNGMVGNMKYTEVKSSGKFSVPNNWQLHFSKIESGAKTYHAYWSCIKGARLLNLLDAKSPGSGIYDVYGKK